MLNLSVGGDAAGGYLVDIHDGEKQGLYRPEGGDSDVAVLVAALRDHDPALADALGEELGGGKADEVIADLTAQRDAANHKVDDLTAQLDAAEKELASYKTPAPGSTTADTSET